MKVAIALSISLYALPAYSLAGQCKSSGPIKVCLPTTESPGKLVVANKKTAVLDYLLSKLTPANQSKIERIGRSRYVVTVATSGVSDAPFFYFTQVKYEKIKGTYLITEYRSFSEHRCNLAPPLESIGSLNFLSGTAVWKSRFPDEIKYLYAAKFPAGARSDLTPDEVDRLLGSVKWKKTPDELCKLQ